MSGLIVNRMKGIENKTYLELGIGDGVNFSNIRCVSKTSVDINGNASFTGTTDAFFATISPLERWDIIFIDANHDYDFVLNDFNNAIGHCNEWLAIHDMIPPSKKHTAKRFCSDSYKLLYYLLTETRFEVYPMNVNMGMTFVKMPVRPVYPHRRFKGLAYPNFMEFIKTVRLYGEDEMITILDGDS